MVNGSFKTPKPKPKLPPELRGGKLGWGWYEDAIRDSRIANKDEAMKHDCEYCDEPIEGKAYWAKKLDGWVCGECKEIIENEHKK